MTIELFKETIASNIKNERIARGFSMDELAQLMGLTPGYLRLIERGERGTTAFNLYKLSNLFNLDIQRLITENNDYEQDDILDSKIKKISSLSIQLNDKELDFILMVMKKVVVIRCNNKKDKSLQQEPLC